MKTYQTNRRRNARLFSILMGITVFFILIIFILMLRNDIRRNERLDTTQRYMSFENKVERLLYTRVNLLQGLIAYTQTVPDIFDGDTDQYVASLFSEEQEYISNIGIFQDTTLIWNYPQSGNNDFARGVDFATIENQKDVVLGVKQNLVPMLQGPIELYQGGEGFIIRLPILAPDSGQYWGQISAVLKTDKILEEIDSQARDLHLKLEISNNAEAQTPFYRSDENLNKSTNFHIDPDFINWRVKVELSNSLSDNLLLYIFLLLVAAMLASTFGIFTYKYLKSHLKILEVSMTDHLTGLYNRRFLEDYQLFALSSARREGHHMAVIMIDLNRFKAVNDTFGHAVGDKVLIETARILTKFTRTNEVIFRLGGDEFLILIPILSDQACLDRMKNRLAIAFDHEFHIPNYEINIDFGLGYAIFPKDGEDFDTLLRVADKRMYEDKQ